MLVVSTLLTEVGTILNDVEAGNAHIRWSEPELMNYITEATAAIAQAKPSVFMMYDNIELRPGSMQRVPDPFLKLINVLFNINQDGSDGAPVFVGVQELQHYFTKPSCPMGGLIHTFSILNNANRLFEVTPAVPVGLPYVPKVRAVLMLRPDIITSRDQWINMPDSDGLMYQGALVDWMLYRTYSKDQESTTSIERSKFHFTSFQAYISLSTIGSTPSRINTAQPRRAA